MLTWGAMIQSKDNQGLSPLHVACYNGHVNIALLLVENGADIERLDVIGHDNPWEEFYDESSGRPYWCHMETDESTWESPPKPKGGKGWTPVICACMTEKIEILEFLAKEGANLATADNSGRTGIHIAAMIGSLEMLDFLLKPPIKGVDGLDLFKKDNTHMTPLHYAARFDKPEMVDAIVHRMDKVLNKRYTKPSDHAEWPKPQPQTCNTKTSCEPSKFRNGKSLLVFIRHHLHFVSSSSQCSH